MSKEKMKDNFKAITRELLKTYSPVEIGTVFLGGRTDISRGAKITDIMADRRGVSMVGLTAIQFIKYYHDNIGDLRDVTFDDNGLIQWPAKPMPVSKRKPR